MLLRRLCIDHQGPLCAAATPPAQRSAR